MKLFTVIVGIALIIIGALLWNAIFLAIGVGIVWVVALES